MPIKVNDGGVLKTLGAVTVNDNGVVRNLGQLSANDSGVVRGVYSSKKVKVSGISTLAAGNDYIVVANSGAFTLTAPKGAKITVAGGGMNGQKNSSSSGNGGSGGFVAQYTLSSDIKNASCTVTIGAAKAYNRSVGSGTLSSSTLKIGSNTYSSGSVVQIIQTKWGVVGGNGGKGFYCDSSSGSKPTSSNPDGTGAGGGGGGISKQYGGDYYGKGGSGGYNWGGDGGSWYDGDWGRSGAGGAQSPDNESSYTKVGGGGGGGYAAGGGGNSCQESVWYNSNEDCNEYSYHCSEPGCGGSGVVVIEW